MTVSRAYRAIVLLCSLPTPHAAPLRGLKAPVRSLSQALAECAHARSVFAGE